MCGLSEEGQQLQCSELLRAQRMFESVFRPNIEVINPQTKKKPTLLYEALQK